MLVLPLLLLVLVLGHGLYKEVQRRKLLKAVFAAAPFLAWNNEIEGLPRAVLLTLLLTAVNEAWEEAALITLSQVRVSPDTRTFLKARKEDALLLLEKNVTALQAELWLTRWKGQGLTPRQYARLLLASLPSFLPSVSGVYDYLSFGSRRGEEELELLEVDYGGAGKELAKRALELGRATDHVEFKHTLEDAFGPGYTTSSLFLPFPLLHLHNRGTFTLNEACSAAFALEAVFLFGAQTCPPVVSETSERWRRKEREGVVWVNEGAGGWGARDGSPTLEVDYYVEKQDRTEKLEKRKGELREVLRGGKIKADILSSSSLQLILPPHLDHLFPNLSSLISLDLSTPNSTLEAHFSSSFSSLPLRVSLTTAWPNFSFELNNWTVVVRKENLSPETVRRLDSLERRLDL